MWEGRSAKCTVRTRAEACQREVGVPDIVWDCSVNFMVAGREAQRALGAELRSQDLPGRVWKASEAPRGVVIWAWVGVSAAR